jgi:hypothetical protein
MFQSAVALCIYREGGLDALHAIFRANFADLANQFRKKLGTITGPVRTRTVHTISTDRLASRSYRPPASFDAQHNELLLLNPFIFKDRAINLLLLYFHLPYHTCMFF